MARMHDMGGRAGAGPLQRQDHDLSEWEILADAVNQALKARGVRATDELRRAVEDLDPEQYESLSYYDRWTAGVEALLIEKRLLSREDIDRKQAELEGRGSS